MTRLMSTINWEVRLQWRNGFYYAAIFIVVVFLLAFSQISVVKMDWLLPFMLVNNMVVGTFYFLGALILLEKDEGSLEARVITPLRPAEYLTAKVATLSALTLVESALIVVITVGTRCELAAFTGWDNGNGRLPVFGRLPGGDTLRFYQRIPAAIHSFRDARRLTTGRLYGWLGTLAAIPASHASHLDTD